MSNLKRPADRSEDDLVVVPSKCQRVSTGSFLRTRPSNYMGLIPKFQRPAVNGYFSLKSQREYCEGMEELRYICMPSDPTSVSFDLNVGVEAMIANDEHRDEKLDNILKWISENSERLSRSFADIVCYRGLLTLLMCTPYESKEGWIILGTKWKGVLYLCAKETDAARIQRIERTEKQKRFMAWGFKFEDYMTSETPGGKPNPQQPLEGKPEFCVVFRSKMNDLRLLYGAEMDGVVSNTEVRNLQELQDAEFIELKTNRLIENERQYQNFKRYKLVKWWGQSYLVGTERLFCGYRDDAGIVREVKEHKVKDFPKLAKKIWDPFVCINFCDSFLMYAKGVVQEEDPTTVWKFVYTPGGAVTYTVISGPSEFSFLPSWFTSEVAS